MEQATVWAIMNFLAHQSPAVVLVLALGLLSPFGMTMLIFVFWQINERKRERALAAYREDTKTILERYGADMAKLAGYYESNVELVKRFAELGGDLKSVIILNTQTITRLCDGIDRNQYCPMVRVTKEPVEVAR